MLPMLSGICLMEPARIYAYMIYITALMLLCTAFTAPDVDGLVLDVPVQHLAYCGQHNRHAPANPAILGGAGLGSTNLT